MENFKVVAHWHEYVLASDAQQERLKSHQQRIADKKKEIEQRTQLGNEHLLAELTPPIRRQQALSVRDRGNELKRLNEEIKTLEASTPVLPKAMGLKKERLPTSPFICVELPTLGKEAPRQFLQIVSGKYQEPTDDATRGGCNWRDGSPAVDHLPTSRVMVNRIWRGHFGAGLVRSVDNFGQLGEAASHQPLLVGWPSDSSTQAGRSRPYTGSSCAFEHVSDEQRAQ